MIPTHDEVIATRRVIHTRLKARPVAPWPRPRVLQKATNRSLEPKDHPQGYVLIWAPNTEIEEDTGKKRQVFENRAQRRARGYTAGRLNKRVVLPAVRRALAERLQEELNVVQ